MRLTFLGATETVTGSRFLIETDTARVLVDCGLYQGLKYLRERNWEPFPVPPETLDAVVLTHAHIDHSGYLPGLVAHGFTGTVHATSTTAELCQILLPDAAHLQEEDAEHHNRRGSSRHEPALPLYTAADAEQALRQFEGHPMHVPFSPAPGLTVTFTPAGHILGASCVRVSDGKVDVVFTGDVGRADDPVMLPPEPLGACDYLVTESTYGNRAHPDNHVLDDFLEIVERTIHRHGTLLIPSFAVGRAQTMLHLIAELRAQGRFPDVPVYLNSPMAIDTTEMFLRHRGEHRLTDEQVAAMCHGVTFVRTAEESIALNEKSAPCVVISASGMATGGRVLHHLEKLAPDHRNTVMFVGYQAAGTRGDAMLNGAKEIKMFGQYVKVRCEVALLDGLSAHADYDEMSDWLAQMPAPPRHTFIVHGEPAAQDAFRRVLRDRLGWDATIPRFQETAILT